MNNLMIGDIVLELNTASLHRSVHMAPKTRSAKWSHKCSTLIHTDVGVPADLKFLI